MLDYIDYGRDVLQNLLIAISLSNRQSCTFDACEILCLSSRLRFSSTLAQCAQVQLTPHRLRTYANEQSVETPTKGTNL